MEAVVAGDHACLTFSDPEERLDMVAAFVHAGLGTGQKVLCLTEAIAPPQLSQELANRLVPVREPLRTGQLQIHGSDQSWLASGTPTATGMIDMLSAQLELATGEGYPGLRVSADMVWATGPLAAIEQLLVFESDVTTLFGDGRLTVICQYDRDRFDPVTLMAAAQAHHHTVAAAVYHDDALLRVCRQYRPPGLRLAGEIDATHAEVLVAALAEALRLDHDLYVNLAALRFIDASSASAIVRAALSLPADRTMTVMCRGVVLDMIKLCGAGEAQQLRVRERHGES
ncbi:MAG: hypothetical protein AUI14_23525 [Actinobacteria bacterium 13_2_20CM_2_71_6]|nr:MAG: hypothetical protein AUI14_23525 [Actinobacteria bacterium 13_2_20CM_2_71_6]